MKLKWDNDGLKSPLARARGLGAAGHGSEHWMAQRLTAIANIPLVLWFAYSVVALHDTDYAGFIVWLAQPLNAILMILLIVSGLYHATLGIQLITEDYIHSEGFKAIKLMLQKLLFIALGVASVFSILKIAL